MSESYDYKCEIVEIKENKEGNNAAVLIIRHYFPDHIINPLLSNDNDRSNTLNNINEQLKCALGKDIVNTIDGTIEITQDFKHMKDKTITGYLGDKKEEASFRWLNKNINKPEGRAKKITLEKGDAFIVSTSCYVDDVYCVQESFGKVIKTATKPKKPKLTAEEKEALKKNNAEKKEAVKKAAAEKKKAEKEAAKKAAAEKKKVEKEAAKKAAAEKKKAEKEAAKKAAAEKKKADKAAAKKAATEKKKADKAAAKKAATEKKKADKAAAKKKPITTTITTPTIEPENVEPVVPNQPQDSVNDPEAMTVDEMEDELFENLDDDLSDGEEQPEPETGFDDISHISRDDSAEINNISSDEDDDASEIADAVIDAAGDELVQDNYEDDKVDVEEPKTKHTLCFSDILNIKLVLVTVPPEIRLVDEIKNNRTDAISVYLILRSNMKNINIGGEHKIGHRVYGLDVEYPVYYLINM